MKSYENCWALKLLLDYMLCENFKEKNDNSIRRELFKKSMLPKKHALGLLEVILDQKQNASKFSQ